MLVACFKSVHLLWFTRLIELNFAASELRERRGAAANRKALKQVNAFLSRDGFKGVVLKLLSAYKIHIYTDKEAQD